jgi:tetratricopeptide (TPR) repeat protein
MELTDYYCKAVEEYSKPLQTVGKKERIFELEDLYSKQSKEIENLKKDLDKFIKENTQLKNDLLEGKSVVRAKITEAMNNYESAIKNIQETHETLQTKLSYLEKFVTYFDEQFKFFNSSLEEKKKLQDHIISLECEIKMIDINTKEEEILALRELNMKLSRELELKEKLVKEYEAIISTNKNSSVTDRKRSNEVSQGILTLNQTS